MKNNDFHFIQDQIAYNFKNLDLLQQAFVRRSYSKENGGEDNKVLDFFTRSSSKKDAKKSSAFKMLKYILEEK